jgi:membrane protein YdbS with pleckstrin-like domain
MTAASGDIDISIHGLEATTAEQLKEWIMEKIAAHASPGV